MKALFKRFLTLVFIFTAGSFFSQNFKTEVRVIDPANGSIKAGLLITEVTKTQMDELVLKINKQSLFTVISNEFAPAKNVAQISFKSNGAATIKDFESFLKQLEVYSVVYNHQTISSQELALNYKEPNKTEIKKTDRIK